MTESLGIVRYQLKQPALDKRDLIASIERERAWFDAIVARVPPERLAEPGLPGGWSVRDVLAHIAWCARQNAGVARARALVGSDLWGLPEDERNAAVREQSRIQTVAEILREYRESHRDLLAEIEKLSDEELNDPREMADLVRMIPGRRPWRVLYDPGHYADHGRAIEDWLRSTDR